MSNLVEERLQEQRLFLEKNGYQNAAMHPIVGDASRRVFTRLSLKGKNIILIDANPDKGEEPIAYAGITHLLRDSGLHAPEIIAQDLQNGFFIVEDLGGQVFGKTLAQNPNQKHDFYRLALDGLVHLHLQKFETSFEMGGMQQRLYPYDMNRLLNEAKLFTQWYVPAITKRPISSMAADEFSAILKGMLLPVLAISDKLVLRDYHADNLIFCEDKKGLQQLGLIDFQDALLGNPAYDVMSLLQDARYDTETSFEKEMLAYYLQQAKIFDSESFLRDYEVLAVQRHLKVLGIFVRLAVRDKKTHYLAHTPRLWHYLDTLLQQERFSVLHDWFDRWLPANIRYELAA